MPPSIASGLPGNLVDAYLAGIIPIKVKLLVVIFLIRFLVYCFGKIFLSCKKAQKSSSDF